MVTALEQAGAELSFVPGHSSGGRWRKKRVVNVPSSQGVGGSLPISQMR